jgi:hypothetical protein
MRIAIWRASSAKNALNGAPVLEFVRENLLAYRSRHQRRAIAPTLSREINKPDA